MSQNLWRQSQHTFTFNNFFFENNTVNKVHERDSTLRHTYIACLVP